MYSLALDFDGVICDSQKECFATAGKLFEEKNSQFNFKLFLDKKYSVLKSYRHYVISGEDYYLIIEAIYGNFNISSQSYFNEYKMSRASSIKEIKHDFYKIRKESINQDLHGWLNDNKIYKDIDNKINYLLNDFNVFIVTTKDKYSVSKILKFYDIKIDYKNIFSKELKKTKSECLKEIIEICSSSQIAFIDDQIENLLSIDIPEVDLYLATWGYNDLAQIQKATKSNIQLINLDEFPGKIVSTY